MVCLKVYFEKEEIRAVQDPPLYLFVCSKNHKEKITNNFFFLLAYLIQKDFFVFKSYIHLMLGHFQSSVMLLEMGKCKMEASVLATL